MRTAIRRKECPILGLLERPKRVLATQGRTLLLLLIDWRIRQSSFTRRSGRGQPFGEPVERGLALLVSDTVAGLFGDQDLEFVRHAGLAIDGVGRGEAGSEEQTRKNANAQLEGLHIERGLSLSFGCRRRNSTFVLVSGEINLQFSLRRIEIELFVDKEVLSNSLRIGPPPFGWLESFAIDGDCLAQEQAVVVPISPGSTLRSRL